MRPADPARPAAGAKPAFSHDFTDKGGEGDLMTPKTFIKRKNDF